MAMLSNLALTEMFGALNATTASLHTGFDADGGFEVVGAAYARQPVAFTATTDLRAVNSVDPVATFRVDAGNTVNFVGFWDDTPNFLGMVPLSSQFPLIYILSADLTTVICPNNFALVNGMIITAWKFVSVIPSALEVGRLYQVTNATPNTLQLLEPGGDEILSFFDVGAGFIQQVQPVSFTTAGSLSLGAITLAANALT